MNYYNDNDPFVCDWTRNLIADGLIPDGVVDCRPIQEVEPSDLKGFIQCHWSSTALPAGPSHSNSPESQQIDLFGLPVALVRLSALPGNHAIVRDAKAKCLSGILEKLASRSAPNAETNGSKTNDTFGPKSGALSESVDLQSALGNKLAESADLIGGPLYEVHWGSSATILGPPICRLRASARSISGNGFSGWPRPNAIEPEGPAENPAQFSHARRTKEPGKTTSNLGRMVHLTGWPTPRSTEAGHSTGNPERALDQKSRLEDQVVLTGWATPTVRDHKDRAANLENVPVNHLLGREVLLTGWPTPISNDAVNRTQHVEGQDGKLSIAVLLTGQTSNGSPAPMPPATDSENTGQLASEFSGWLMGFPVEWQEAAPKK